MRWRHDPPLISSNKRSFSPFEALQDDVNESAFSLAVKRAERLHVSGIPTGKVVDTTEQSQKN